MPNKAPEKFRNADDRPLMWGKTIDRDKMAERIDRTIRETPLRQVFVMERNSVLPPQEKGVSMIKAPRLIIVLAGRMRMEGIVAGVKRELILAPGDAVYGLSYAWTRPLWDLQHEIISLVFHDTYLRALYLNHQTQQPFPEPEFYFNTARQVGSRELHLLQVISQVKNTDASQQEILIMLLQVLLRFSLQEIRMSCPVEGGKANLTRQRVLDYLQANCHLPINRESTAKALKLSPTYLSRTLSQYDGKSFNTHLTEYRMKRAEELLNDPGFTLDEIAYQCGYSYTSYFIAVFEKTHGITPREYRTRE